MPKPRGMSLSEQVLKAIDATGIDDDKIPRSQYIEALEEVITDLQGRLDAAKDDEARAGDGEGGDDGVPDPDPFSGCEKEDDDG